MLVLAAEAREEGAGGWGEEEEAMEGRSDVAGVRDAIASVLTVDEVRELTLQPSCVVVLRCSGAPSPIPQDLSPSAPEAKPKACARPCQVL